MYEDHFDLCTLQRQLIEKPANSRSDNSWWKKLTHRKSKTASAPSCYIVISQFSMPVKRTKELRALTGWFAPFSSNFLTLLEYNPSSWWIGCSIILNHHCWFVCHRRYYFSLFLELSDIGMPFIKAVINKVSDAISFFLVSLIGRSLGLIYTGIRQSLRWKWDIKGGKILCLLQFLFSEK